MYLKGERKNPNLREFYAEKNSTFSFGTSWNVFLWLHR